MLMIKKLLLVVLSPLLVLLLLLTALDWGIVHTVGQPDQVKKIVADSGIYNSVIPNILNQQKTIQTSIGNLPLTDPTIKQAVNRAFTPQLVRSNTEAAIDNLYAWLDGKTAAPSFKFDFSGAQTQLATNLATAARDRAASLPACRTPVSSLSFDVYAASCLPRGLSPSSVGQAVQNQVAAGQGIIDKPVVAAGDIKTDKGQPIFQTQLKNLPTWYQRFKHSPYLLMLLAVVLAAALVWLRPTLRSGLRHVGITLIIVGLVMLLVASAVGWANTNLVQKKLSFNNAAVETDVKQVAGDITQSIDKNYWLFGAVYAVIGLGLLAAPLVLSGRRTPAPAAAPAEPASGPPPTRPNNSKRVVKIQ